VDLAPIEYEGFRVMHCATCKGHLVPVQRLESIKRVDREGGADLKADASAHFKGSTPARLACPRCRMPMRKQAIDLPVLDLHADICRHCELVWLDGGELALVQLGYEASRKFLNAKELRKRIQELESSPERKAEFERNLAKLRKSEDPFEAALGEALEEALGAVLRGLAGMGRY
jgi:Zn-finger nucleic acid-binding protein